MKIDTNTLISISDANQNFSKVTKLVDKYGAAIILKNNKPLYIITEFIEEKNNEEVSDEELLNISNKLIKKNSQVYKELAK
ncbi:type II toxin-antitoxin system Phd/YefM family antitoxin [Ignavigranum ruoffiae]|uniref:type II toxin-antitoxin system Phd/YefM family antitoxin n=1 Tax=Ignavigranum ruoffiae TaxID=89093 RepID=UPI0024AE14CC|nr:type II toxin-antitoxin system Phd/YefM family antitoxin [Ignavigranum ruoffiae]